MQLIDWLQRALSSLMEELQSVYTDEAADDLYSLRAPVIGQSLTSAYASALGDFNF